MPVVCRPFSVNSYALSKIWLITISVDLRAGDSAAIASLCESYIYQDMLDKPSELVLYRKVEQGGLGLHNTKCKSFSDSHFPPTFSNPCNTTHCMTSKYQEWNSSATTDRILLKFETQTKGNQPKFKNACNH